MSQKKGNHLKIRFVDSLGKDISRRRKCIIYYLSFFGVQASQAAQEAEINARKAKNSVTNLLNLINDLLEQLGKYLQSLQAVFEFFVLFLGSEIVDSKVDITVQRLYKLNRDF